VTRPKLEDEDRLYWISLLRLLGTGRETLHIVKPDTVVRWHREGFRHDWRRSSKARTIGRPTIGWELVYLIKRRTP
jgi:putative transposase